MGETDMEIMERKSGEILFYCQIIESDLKVIYSCLISSNLDSLKRNVDGLNDATLGKLLMLLKEKELLLPNDIKILHDLRKIRNYVVHQSFLDFAFLVGKEKDKKMKEIYELLSFDSKRLKDAMERLEKVRLRLVEKYRR